jgi:mannan endo-1,4-beta-mannosidase
MFGASRMYPTTTICPEEIQMNRVLVFLVALCVAAQGVALCAAQPANPKTNAKARAILTYLEKLPEQGELRMLSGQFHNWYGSPADTIPCADVHATTGHWPAMLGLDYADQRNSSFQTKNINRAAIDYARAGGLVTLSCHMHNPANPQGGGLRDTGVDLAQLLDPNTEAHSRWMQELDAMAAGLAELQDVGVVVLWRPFHEMNGGWFWWGGRPPETFIPLWRHMFDYFTNTKGLNNLLWVYGPNQGKRTAAYYAGDRYVDIVGLDAYTNDIDPQHIGGYDEVAKLPKPFGFTEFGPHGPHNPPGNYDYLRFLDGVKKHFPKTTFFLAWDWKWGLASNHNTKELLNSPAMVNREDLPAEFAAGGK